MIRTYALSEIGNLRVLGRTPQRRDPLTLFWTASGIEMLVTGSELYVDFTVDYDWFEPWIEIVIDGTLSQRRMLDRGIQRVCMFRRMEPGIARHVRVLKATQAIPGDEAALLQISAIAADGEFLPLPKPAMRVEVIGDSITSGEGLAGAITENTWNASVFGACNSYHVLLGKALTADVHVVSQSGYGVYCNWCGDVRESLPQYYEAVCGVLRGERNVGLGAREPWDFSAWQPDYIIVNLGTNDSGSFDHTGEWFEDGGGQCAMRLNPDGNMFADDRAQIWRAVMEFLRLLRLRNPDSFILWCYGMLPGRLTDTLREAVAAYRRATRDERVAFLLLPETREGEYGARRHPGPEAHRRAAEALEKWIRATQQRRGRS